jgi:hypothetical protein
MLPQDVEVLGEAKWQGHAAGSRLQAVDLGERLLAHGLVRRRARPTLDLLELAVAAQDAAADLPAATVTIPLIVMA